mmetsp:Transcript_15722/g.46640  ORF Transcript_15722/g.46640 Transcript_15722/m.46640 type:complete len:249 (+) Transcript_15722:1466-2212(+)
MLQAVIAVLAFLVANDVDGPHIRAEADVRQNAIIFGGELEMLQHFLLLRPSLPILRWVHTLVLHDLLPPPYVERTQLGLQFGAFVRRCDPAIAADLVIPVKAHDVGVAGFHVHDQRFQAVVASADDAGGMRPLVALGLEGREAPHRHIGPHLIGVQQRPGAAALLDDEPQVLRLRQSSRRQRLFHVLDLGACLARERDLLLRAVKLHRYGLERVAEDPAGALPLGVEDMQTHVDHRSLLLGNGLLLVP